MKYQNPVVKGFYPDPSVCFANGKYYMVCSSFQYFPAVPLFESENLVNWRQLGCVLTRRSQVMLEKVSSSGGIFAPTIRYHAGRFYMVTTNDTTHQNFYVYTDDIYGEWSEPVFVAQGGIDPSLYFEDGRAYFMSNGCDDNGVSGVVQCGIDIETGKKLTESRTIWQGSGGRYLESPHLYRIGKYYYLMAAEGGTEYGHMITYARAEALWGPYEGYAGNPVLTNRNKAPEIIQGIGHGDLICDLKGNWHILSLGFRQIDIWMPYHNLGREVFLTPVVFEEDGWFRAGRDGTCEAYYEVEGDFVQEPLGEVTFANTDWRIDWCYLRHPNPECYGLSEDRLILHGTEITLEEADSPTFLGVRQREFDFRLRTELTLDTGEAGVTVYMCENEHYDIAVRRAGDGGYEAVLKLNIGGVKHIQNTLPLKTGGALLEIRANRYQYDFFVDGQYLGSGQTKYLSSEVSGGFTGVMLACYAIGENTAKFEKFRCLYEKTT